MGKNEDELAAATKSNLYKFLKYDIEEARYKTKYALNKTYTYIRHEECAHTDKSHVKTQSSSQGERPQKKLLHLGFLAC